MRDIVQDLKQTNKSLDADVMSDFNIILGNFNSRSNTTYDDIMTDIYTSQCRIHQLDQLYNSMHKLN
jgi:hypothetical protein